MKILSEVKELCNFYELKRYKEKITFELVQLYKEQGFFDESRRLFQEYVTLRKEDGDDETLTIDIIYNDFGKYYFRYLNDISIFL